MTAMTDQAAQSPNQPETAAGSAIPPAELDRITSDIIAALTTVYDPEIPADIYELGLIYRVDIADDRLMLAPSLTWEGADDKLTLFALFQRVEGAWVWRVFSGSEPASPP